MKRRMSSVEPLPADAGLESRSLRPLKKGVAVQRAGGCSQAEPRVSRSGAFVALCVLCLAACGSDASPQSENYGNVLASPSGLVLVQEEHQTGWGRADCFACHNANNIHQVNRTGLPDDEADLANVRAIVHNQGESSCVMCHGANGVEP